MVEKQYRIFLALENINQCIQQDSQASCEITVEYDSLEDA